MNSNERSDSGVTGLERDVPTTPADVATLRGLRLATSSWLLLSPAELEVLIPPGALQRRPPTSSNATPFKLD